MGDGRREYTETDRNRGILSVVFGGVVLALVVTGNFEPYMFSRSGQVTGLWLVDFGTGVPLYELVSGGVGLLSVGFGLYSIVAASSIGDGER